MSIEYVEDADLRKMVREMIDADFSKLNALGVVVLSVMKVNVDKNSENKQCKTRPVTTKKVGPAERVYIKDNAHFIIVMDYTTWNETNDAQRRFLVDHGLSNIHAERGEKSVIFSTVKPDINIHSATIKRRGPVFPNLLDLRDTLGRGKSVPRMVNKLEQKAAAEPAPDPEPLEPESDLPEPEPDLPPPRRVKKVLASSE